MATRAVHWRLHYLDDMVIDEPEGDASIRLARPDAAVLVLTRKDQPEMEPQPFLKILLMERDELGKLQRYRPIFYAKRSATSFGARAQGLRTEGIVVGRGRERDNEVDAKLWLLTREGRCVDCPESMLDRQMIQLQVMEPEPGPLVRN